MIVSDSNKFIFIHIPRTAGTYVSKKICNSLGVKKWREFIGEPKKLINREGNALGNCYSGEYSEYESNKHITAKNLKNKIGKKKWKSYFKFAFIRNPWDRILSIYLKKRREATGIRRFLFENSKFKFNSYVILKYGLGVGKVMRQTEYVEDENGHIIVDYIGRYEKLEKDLEKIYEKLMLESRQEEPYDGTENVSYKNYFLNMTKRIVKKKFRKEIEKFDYTF
jgi:hypothetical protein